MNPLLKLMHDTAHDLANIDSEVWLLKNKFMPEELEKRLNSINQSRRDLMNKLDKFYIENKNKF